MGIGSLKKRLRTFSLSVCSKNLMHVRAPAPNKKELHSNTFPQPAFSLFYWPEPPFLQKRPPNIARSQPYPPLPRDF